jgi:hypothetical protein
MHSLAASLADIFADNDDVAHDKGSCATTHVVVFSVNDEELRRAYCAALKQRVLEPAAARAPLRAVALSKMRNPLKRRGSVVSHCADCGDAAPQLGDISSVASSRAG